MIAKILGKVIGKCESIGEDKFLVPFYYKLYLNSFGKLFMPDFPENGSVWIDFQSGKSGVITGNSNKSTITLHWGVFDPKFVVI